MARKIESILNLAADIQNLGNPRDNLSYLISRYDDELAEDELDLVSAATGHPDYAQFKKLLDKEK